MNILGAQLFSVGESYPKLAIKSNCAYVQFWDKHLYIFVFVNRPSGRQLISANTVNNGLKLSAFCYHDTIAIAIKPGNLPWHDAYLTPHCVEPMSLPTKKIAEGSGVSACYFFVDSSCGRIHEIRAFALSNKFSNYLIDNMNVLLEKEFDINDYQKKIEEIQMRYTPAQIGMVCKQCYFNLR